jgi:hypothetical protein
VPPRATRLSLVACATLLVSLPATASADGELIGILRIDASGVSDSAEARFEQSVIDGLGATGHYVMDRKSVQKALAGSRSYVDGCTFGPCMRAVHEATRLRLVLVARIEGVGRTYSFVVSLIDARSGELTSQVAQACPVCTVEDAITTATLSAVELVTGAGAASVADPEAGPTGRPRPDRSIALRAEVERDRRALRRAGWLTVAGGVGAAIGGLVLIKQDVDWGPALVGGGVGLVAAGGLIVGLSTRFELD